MLCSCCIVHNSELEEYICALRRWHANAKNRRRKCVPSGLFACAVMPPFPKGRLARSPVDGGKIKQLSW
jgi:hypothetical protein